MNEAKNAVLNLLFRQGEGICLGGLNEFKVKTLDEALSVESAEMYAVNPLHPTKSKYLKEEWHRADVGHRADCNVTSFRNFVIEFDKGDIEEQAYFLESRNVPYSVLTFSGSKSLHAIIALSESLPDIETYKETFRTISKILWTADKSCINPSRMTRLAGAIRADTGKEQKLLELRRPISQYELRRWVGRFQKHLDKVNERDRQAKERQTVTLPGAGLAALTPTDLAFLNGEWNGKGSRHSRLVALAHKMHDAGVSEQEAWELLSKAHVALGIERDLSEVDRIINYVY